MVIFITILSVVMLATVDKAYDKPNKDPPRTEQTNDEVQNVVRTIPIVHINNHWLILMIIIIMHVHNSTYSYIYIY